MTELPPWVGALLAGGGAGVIARWLITEVPYVRTIRHQERELRQLRQELTDERGKNVRLRLYLDKLTSALRAEGLEVPEPPHGRQGDDDR